MFSFLPFSSFTPANFMASFYCCSHCFITDDTWHPSSPFQPTCTHVYNSFQHFIVHSNCWKCLTFLENVWWISVYKPRTLKRCLLFLCVICNFFLKNRPIRSVCIKSTICHGPKPRLSRWRRCWPNRISAGNLSSPPWGARSHPWKK